MHEFGDILYWAVNKHCRTHQSQACDLVREIEELVAVGRQAGALATGLAGVIAFVKKRYGDEAATVVGALGALGILALLATRIQQIGQPAESGRGTVALS